MGSTRLPGKVLMDIAGRPMLARVVERLGRCERLTDILVARTQLVEDRAIIGATGEFTYAWPGRPEDVLGRYTAAAAYVDADVIVRITADCPLIDPEVVDAAVAKLTADPSRYDFVSNCIRRTYPKGLDVEVFWRDTLERMNRLAISAEDREHVCTYAYRTRPDLFRLGEVWDEGGDNSDLNWSVDTAEDLARIRWFYDCLPLAREHIGYRNIIRYERQALLHAATV